MPGVKFQTCQRRLAWQDAVAHVHSPAGVHRHKYAVPRFQNSELLRGQVHSRVVPHARRPHMMELAQSIDAPGKHTLWPPQP